MARIDGWDSRSIRVENQPRREFAHDCGVRQRSVRSSQPVGGIRWCIGPGPTGRVGQVRIGDLAIWSGLESRRGGAGTRPLRAFPLHKIEQLAAFWRK